MDSIIDLIGAAQKPDGYLYKAHTTGVSAGILCIQLEVAKNAPAD